MGGFRRAAVTITAADPDGLQANQGFNVTVEAESSNQAPVAVGTIPGSRLQIGGTSTIDVAGHFRDPDGDELSYTGSSSNETVATIAMEGSTATISAIAVGEAVITITASDGSASVSQSFRIDVPAGPEEATVVISRLLDANRQQISDPSGIAGTIYAVLDVQSNDETWTEIGLTLNGETVSPLCRGTGGTSADVAVGPGLAAAGQVEIECVLKTDDVLGECVGMQLEPKYANGEYELSAFLTTDAGDRREVVASQPIELGNSNFVQIAHVPGSASELGNHTKGLTFYGGPAVEGNVNMFHACPVAYDGTVVGSMQLSTVVTDTEQNLVDAPGPTFRTRRGGPAFPVDDEAPFTWSIITDWWSGNHAYWSEGAENVPGETETWIVNSGIITDPNGLDVGSKFRSAGEAKLGPLHFDYRAPNTSSDDSQISISRLSGGAPVYGPTSQAYYYDGTGSNPMRLWISDMTERGVGHVYGTTSAIAVGDCSVRANADTRGSTAFTALEGYENITHITQLAEEDPVRDAVNDGGGIDCYVAELQALADRLGNAVDLGEEPRIRTATTFGVDRTPPVISRERPSEALVLNENALSFEIEDPRFESGEDGSQQRAAAYAYAGDSRYWVTSNHYWSSSVDISTGSATVDITPPQTTPTHRFAREEEHTVYIWARDNAGNSAFTSFTFTRDHSPPALALSAVPSSFGLTQAASVSVTVAGTLSDATEIRRAFLSIHHADANGACTEENPLASTQVANPVRRLHNGTNKIEFSEVFTVKKAGDSGATNYCFFLRAEDDARDANGGGDENSYEEVVSTFGVVWPGTGPQGPVAVTATLPATSLQIGGTAMVDAAGHFSDPNNDALTYTAASSDEAVATVSVTGSEVTATAVALGTATITITASDGDSRTADATATWEVTVAAVPVVPAPPVATATPIAAANVQVGAQVAIDVSGEFTDANDDALTFSAASSDATVAAVVVSGSTVTAVGVAPGTATITITASDGDAGTADATKDWAVTVGAVPAAPVATATPIADATVPVGAAETIDVAGEFTDANGDALTYSAASDDMAVATVSVTGSEVTAMGVAEGMATITITATDGSAEATKDWSVTVQEYGIVLTGADDMPLTSLAVSEDDSTTYKVALSRAPTADVTVAISVAEANRAVYADLDPASLTFTDANWDMAQDVKVKTVTHDANTDNEAFTLTHDPSGAEYETAASASLSGMVNDDEITLSLTGVPAGFSENDDNIMVTLTATTAVADTFSASNRTFTVTLPVGDASDVTWYNGDPTDATNPGSSVTSVDLILETNGTSVDTVLYLDPADDAVMDEGMEMFELTSGAVAGGGIGASGIAGTINVMPTSFTMADDDPDYTIQFNGMDALSIAENVGSEQMVTVTVMDPNGNTASADRVFAVTIPATATVAAGGTTAITYTTRGLTSGGVLTVTVGPGATSGTGTFYLTPAANSGDGNSTIAVTAAVTPAAKASGTNYTIGLPTFTLTNDDS